MEVRKGGGEAGAGFGLVQGLGRLRQAGENGVGAAGG
jgi:hypothetical protein